VHLACHARQDPADPARSGFELTDGSLTVSALAQENLDGELAFLSACDTSSGSTTLPDEALHLAGAMQFVGYRHVLATLWSIDDADGARVADAVYAALTHGGLPRSQNAARALHQAIDLLRKDNPADPLRWAAYVHFGP
jgi:CHAT domain-containing protein